MNLTFKEVQLLFHTNLRNVGLFTSISLAMLGYSRYYRKISQLYNITFILISIAFLGIATYLDIILLRNLERTNKNIDKKYSESMDILLLIPKLLLGINSIVFLFTSYTLFREYSR
jgi:hypothetical protein